MQKAQFGEYYLTQNRTGYWCRTWYDSDSKQRRSKSLGTSDFEDAKRLLRDWFLNSRKLSGTASDIRLDYVLATYYDEHAKHLASQESALYHTRLWVEFFGSAKVAEVTPSKQREFLCWISKTRSDAYAKRVFATGRAALNYAMNHEIVSQIRIIPPASVLKASQSKPRGRPLEIEEVRAWFDAIDYDPMRRYLTLLIGTWCRPEPALKLDSSQIDDRRGLIHLNPIGRDQNKKYRPVVRLPSFILKDCEGNWIYRGGDGAKSIRRAIRTSRERAGFGTDVNSTSIRHTMARWAREQGCSGWDVACQLGHKVAGTTEVYAEFDPKYLRDTLDATEAFWKITTNRNEI